MGDSASPSLFAAPCEGKKSSICRLIWGQNMCGKPLLLITWGGSKGHLGQLLLSIWNVWLDWMKMSLVIEEIGGGAVMFNLRCFVTWSLRSCQSGFVQVIFNIYHFPRIWHFLTVFGTFLLQGKSDRANSFSIGLVFFYWPVFIAHTWVDDNSNFWTYNWWIKIFKPFSNHQNFHFDQNEFFPSFAMT